jgi:hypothetical protein
VGLEPRGEEEAVGLEEETEGVVIIEEVEEEGGRETKQMSSIHSLSITSRSFKQQNRSSI